MILKEKALNSFHVRVYVLGPVSLYEARLQGRCRHQSGHLNPRGDGRVDVTGIAKELHGNCYNLSILRVV